MPSAELALELGLPLPPGYKPRYNVAPQQEAPIVLKASGSEAEIRMMRWGLVPFWADDPAIGNRMINARSETAASKPAFRAAFSSRRCLVPVDGFYEWMKVPGEKRKQPFWIHRESRRPFTFAGLWERWDRGEEPLETFTILTCPPSELMRPIHDRMPVIIPAEARDEWLDPAAGKDELQALLRPFSDDELQARPVSTLVNSPANDVAECLEPFEWDEVTEDGTAQGELGL